jgi:glycine/sarcosine N-methyltransferase
MTEASAAHTHGANYDQLVDWSKRLEREAPFFRGVFEDVRAQSVCDVGTGSGRHAIMFSEWGLTVYAVDPDPGMLARARVNAEEAGVDLPLFQGGFGGLAGLLPSAVDAITCTGNALPHVDGLTGLDLAIADFHDVLHPGGVLVLHLLNHQRLLDARIRSIPPVVRDTDEGTRAFMRVLDYDVPGYIRFNFVMLKKVGSAEWVTEAHETLHTAMPAYVIVDALDHAGFDRIELFGNHERKPFDAENDESVIIVAHRP